MSRSEEIARIIDGPAFAAISPGGTLSWLRRRQAAQARALAKAADIEALFATGLASIKLTDEMLDAAWSLTVRVTPEERMAMELGDSKTAFKLKMKRRFAAMLSASQPADHVPDVGNMISPPEPVSGWRDIATAPRDGTPILAGSINHKCREVVCWQDGLPRGQIEVEGAVEEGWVNDGQLKDRFHANPNYFTHWMPLPSPPSEPGVK